MSKQFTVITKDGSKWLRPTHVLSDVFNVIYIGSRPEGTTVDEIEVREVKQWQGASGAWWNCATMLDMPNTPKRTVYTDIEPSKHEYISQSEAIDGFVKLTAQHALAFFNLIGLQTHMQCTVVDPSTGTEYEFSFIKKEKK